MRLIDADKINFKQDDTEVVFEVLHAEPIEAIPVSWIEEWITKNEHTNRYDITDVKWLINDWRKEND